MQHFPFVDLKAQYLSIKTEIDAAIQSVITETAFIKGKYVQQFEQEFAEAYGVKHCIGVANGTDSLYIIMKMLGIGAGDEVITVSNSWISSSETISQTGAKPVFIEPDGFFTIDTDRIEAQITPATKAILPVHLYGQSCDMDALLALCHKHKLYLIEDCAQSHFSAFNGTYVGLFGDAASFSFYPGKNLGAYGDAGCIITNSDALAEKCRMYANHGALVKHNHIIEGINSRLDGLQAAVLSVKLKYVQDWTESRIANAEYYDQVLSHISQIEVPRIRPNTRHSFHLYVIQAQDRDGLRAYLSTHGIATEVHYPVPLPFMPAYAYLGQTEADFPISKSNQQRILSLPMYPELTKEQMQFVAQTISDFYTK
jgi:dTDP-4-amino-4,6-dideoxygalactose transaminase